MNTSMVLEAPAVGARYRKNSTGRVWNIHRLCESGLIGLTEDFYGTECSIRDYVSLEGLAQDYAPA